MRVAVMQPYFMPYAGYFRLFAAADVFVAFDCVQFPRRGWVHRNRLADHGGELQWLTLPLAKSDRDTTRICDLQFRSDAQKEWLAETRRFPSLDALSRRQGPLAEAVFELGNSPCDYIIRGLAHVATALGVERRIVRSSELGVDPGLRAQERIIDIVRRMGGDKYVNAPGGRDLYDRQAFDAAGIRLEFLADYMGGYGSVLERLVLESPAEIARELSENLELQPG
jgi:hypothetical protein